MKNSSKHRRPRIGRRRGLSRWLAEPLESRILLSDTLVVTTQPPSTLTAGVNFGLIVTAQTAGSTTDTNFNGSVTLSDVEGNTLFGSLTVTAVNGVATFTGLQFQQTPEADFDELNVDSSGLTEIQTDSFSINPGTASQFSLDELELPFVEGTSFDVAGTVEDQFGNPDSNYAGNITLALTNNTTGATLSGVLVDSTSFGEFEFDPISISTAGTGYTLRLSAPGLTALTSSPFTVGDGLVFTTQPPGTLTAGQTFTVAVAAQKSSGVADPSFTGNVTLGAYYSLTLGGTTSTAAVAGVATFTNIFVKTFYYSSDAITAGTNSLSAADSSFIDLNAGAVTQLAFSNFASSGNVAPPFSVQVNAEDTFGNVNTNFSNNVTLALNSNPSGATLGGTLTVGASQGMAIFDGLTLNKFANGYTLKASSAGVPSVISSPFSYVDTISVTTEPPASVVAGTPFGFSIEAQTPDLTLDPNYNSVVTLTVSNYNINGGVLMVGGSLTTQLVNGTATFSGLTENVISSFAFVITGPGLSGVSAFTTGISVVGANANHLVIVGQPTGPVTIGSGIEIDVAAEDPFGNIDSNFAGTLSLALTADPAGGTLSGTLTATTFNGTASFFGLSLSKPGTGYVIGVSSSNGITATATNTITETASGVPTTLALSPNGSYVYAGSPYFVVATLQDSNGLVDTSFNGNMTISVASGPSTTIGGTLTVKAVNGVAQFNNLAVNTTGDFNVNTALYPFYVFQVTGDGFTSDTYNIEPQPGSLAQVAISTISGPIVAGAPFDVDVVGEDSFGNGIASFVTPVTLSLGQTNNAGTLGGTLTLTPADGTGINMVVGIASFSGLTISSPGTGYTIKATAAGLMSAISSPFDVITDQLAVTTQPPSNISTTGTFGLAVTADNGSGDVDSAFTGQVTLSLLNLNSAGSLTLAGTTTVAAQNGVASFAGLSITQAGQYVIIASATDLGSATSDTIAVNAIATQLTASAQPPATVVVGTGFSLAVSAEDASGNVVSTYNGTITIVLQNNPGSATLGGTLSAQAQNGVADFSGLTLNQPGNGYTIRATASGLTAVTTSAFSAASHAIASQLVITTEPAASSPAGSDFNMVVTAEDPSGITDTTYSGDVTLSLNNFSADPFAQLDGTLTLAAVNGVAAFSPLEIDQAGTFSISAGSGTLTEASSNTFNITPLAATQLAFAAPIDGVLTNGPFTLAVDAEDSFGNIDSAFSGNVTLGFATNPSSAILGGTLHAAAVNGVATFSSLTISKSGSDYALDATISGLTAGTSQAFNVTTDKLSISTQPPASINAGSTFGLVVTAIGGNGNTDRSFTGSVTISDIDGLTLGGTTTVKAVAGVATFSGLSLDQSGFTAITAAATSALNASSNVFDVTAQATELVVTASPSATINANAPFEVDLSAEDSFGNFATGFTGNVTLTLTSNPAAGALVGTIEVTATNGVATFSGISFNTAGTGYIITASSSGLISATTPAISVTGPNAATQLIVTTQPPASVNAGSVFGLVVKAEDDLGATDSSFTGTIAVTDTATGAVIAQTAAVNGVATFSSLSLDLAGDDALSISSGTLTSATTNEILVNPLPASALTVVSPSNNVLSGVGFGVEIAAVDSNGNIDPTYSGSVTISLSANPSGGTLGGTLTTTAVSGIADFSNLTLNTLGGGYVIQAAAGGLSSAETPAFGVSTDQLVIATPPPVSVATHSAFGLTIDAETANGHIDTSFKGAVTLSLVNITGSNGVLAGTLSVKANKGVAKFSKLDIAALGQYDIVAASGNLVGVESNTFQITTGPASKLVFAQPPTSVAHGTAISPPIAVDIEDTYGNLVTSFQGSVVLSILKAPKGVSLKTTFTAAAVNGVATFSNVSFAAAGKYTLAAKSGKLTAPKSVQITVS